LGGESKLGGTLSQACCEDGLVIAANLSGRSTPDLISNRPIACQCRGLSTDTKGWHL